MERITELIDPPPMEPLDSSSSELAITSSGQGPIMRKLFVMPLINGFNHPTFDE